MDPSKLTLTFNTDDLTKLVAEAVAESDKATGYSVDSVRFQVEQRTDSRGCPIGGSYIINTIVEMKRKA